MELISLYPVPIPTHKSPFHLSDEKKKKKNGEKLKSIDIKISLGVVDDMVCHTKPPFGISYTVSHILNMLTANSNSFLRNLHL